MSAAITSIIKERLFLYKEAELSKLPGSWTVRIFF